MENNTNNTKVSKRLDIQVSISDQNLPQTDYLSFLLPTGERVIDTKSYSFNTTDLEEGQYLIEIFAHDEAKNAISSKIMFEINHSIIDPPKSQTLNDTSQILENDTIDYLLLIIIGIICVAIVSVLVVLKQKSKIPQKN